MRDVAHAALEPALAVTDDHVLRGEQDRLARCSRPIGSEARQLTGAGLQVGRKNTGRAGANRLDRLERRGRTRVDLDRPGALAVPDDVDAEQAP